MNHYRGPRHGKPRAVLSNRRGKPPKGRVDKPPADAADGQSDNSPYILHMNGKSTVIAGALATLLINAVPGAAQEALLGIYGAWVLEDQDCSKVFTSDNGRIVFAPKSKDPAPGFIIKPSSISTSEFYCEVKEYKVRLADVTFTGRCDFGRRKKRQKFTMQELNGQYRIEVGRKLVPVKRCDPAPSNK